MKPLIETVRPSDVSRVVLSCLVEIVADEKSRTSGPPFDSKPETPKPVSLAFLVSHQSDKETDFRVVVGVMDLREKEKGVRGGISSELGFGTNLEQGAAGVEIGSRTAPERVRGEERRAESDWSFDLVAIRTRRLENIPRKTKEMEAKCS